MNRSKKLSLIIITKNEAKNIKNCIQSADGLVDEVVVFDSGSTDGTQQICREMGALVFETDWPGFGAQKNRALEKATGQWILSLDADEQLSQELKVEIERILSNDSEAADSYSIPRKSSYCGQFMKHGGWWPDRVVRLFKKSSGRFSDDIVHEKFIPAGKIGNLNSPIIHHAITSAEQSIQKMNAYSTAGAEKIFARDERTSVTKAVLKGLWSFFRTYVLRLGVLDGRMGLILAIANAEGTYYRHIKLWLKQREKHVADKT